MEFRLRARGAYWQETEFFQRQINFASCLGQARSDLKGKTLFRDEAATVVLRSDRATEPLGSMRTPEHRLATEQERMGILILCELRF